MVKTQKCTVSVPSKKNVLLSDRVVYSSFYKVRSEYTAKVNGLGSFLFTGDKWESVLVLIKLLHVFSYTDVQFNFFAFYLVTNGVSCGLLEPFEK